MDAREHDPERGQSSPAMPDPSEADTNVDPGSDVDPDADAVRRGIRERGEEIGRRELREALDRFESRGTLTEEKRTVVARMATAIVDGVLVAPDAALADAGEDNRETVRTAVEFLDPDR